MFLRKIREFFKEAPQEQTPVVPSEKKDEVPFVCNSCIQKESIQTHKVTPSYGKKNRYSHEFIKKIVEEYKSGCPPKLIAQKYSIHRSYVYFIINRNKHK